jgi:DNA-binding transcriptional LysR family regulator
MAFTLRQLSYAVAVADSGSVTKAAEKLGLSQPAISAALNELEREFALSIYVRHPARRIALTPAGKLFIAKARVLLDNVQDFESDATGLSREVKGSIDIGCFAPTVPFIVPLVMASLAERYPGIELHLHEGDLDELNKWLANGDIDATLTYDHRLHPAVRFEPLIDTPIYALLSASDPLAEAEAVSLYDLAERQMIGLDLPITGQFFRSVFQHLGLEPRFRYQVQSYETVRGLVGAGFGFALLIMRPANNRTYDGNYVVCRPLLEEAPVPHYRIAFNAKSQPTRLVHTFADECRRLLKDEGRADEYFVRK